MITSFAFVRAFALVFVMTTGAIAALGFAATQWLVAPPQGRFLTPYMEMPLAPGWRCGWEGTEAVCQKHLTATGTAALDRATIAIFTAKYRGPQDTFACYEQHLRTPRTINGRDGDGKLNSEFVHLKMRKIGAYTWLDALLFQSEVPNYYTQYLATHTSRIGILVTFAVHRRYLADRTREIESMIKKLRIYEGGGTAAYVVGDRNNTCNGQQIADGYAGQPRHTSGPLPPKAQ